MTYKLTTGERQRVDHSALHGNLHDAIEHMIAEAEVRGWEIGEMQTIAGLISDGLLCDCDDYLTIHVAHSSSDRY